VYAGLRAAEKFANLFRDARRIKIYHKAAEEMKAAMEKHLYSEDHGRF